MKLLFFFLSIIGAMGADLATENAQLKAELEKYKTPWRISEPSKSSIRSLQLRRGGEKRDAVIYLPVGSPSKDFENDLTSALNGLFVLHPTKGTPYASGHLEEGLTI